MKTHFSFQNTNEISKKELESYATEEKLQSLTRLLQHGNYDLAKLDIRVEYMTHHNNFEIKMELKVKQQVLVSEETAFSLTEAFDLALEKIVIQLRKLESLKHTKVLHKIRHNRR